MTDDFDTDPSELAPGALNNALPLSPLQARLGIAYIAMRDRARELAASVARVPDVIENDEVQGNVTKLAAMMGTLLDVAEEARVKEKLWFLESGREVDVFFTDIRRPMIEARTKLQIRGGRYLARKKAEAEAAMTVIEQIEAEPVRVRSDTGSLATLKETWAVKSLDMKKLDFKALRPYLTAEMILPAVKAWLKSNRVDDVPQPLKGAEFEKTAKATYRR